MDPTTNLVEFSSQNLEACTNNFSQNNLIGLTQFGRLYRGNLEGQHVVVKIWDGERMKQISSKYNDENLIIKAIIGKREHASINLDSVVHIWAKKEYKSNCSLVHKTLQED
ncbi:hypothetical protein JHK85_001717 [Glycine max]|nr:hypothetical protein JHK85_001717 [Glycine max]KAG5089065.1 hypothetical protein JHK86_001677 [Glycine max]